MQINEDEARPVINRLKRAQGQLNAVIAMVEEGRDCREVVTQLAAVSKAIDRAGFKILATSLKTCLSGDAGPESASAEELEQLFMRLT